MGASAAVTMPTGGSTRRTSARFPKGSRSTTPATTPTPSALVAPVITDAALTLRTSSPSPAARTWRAEQLERRTALTGTSTPTRTSTAEHTASVNAVPARTLRSAAGITRERWPLESVANYRGQLQELRRARSDLADRMRSRRRRERRRQEQHRQRDRPRALRAAVAQPRRLPLGGRLRRRARPGARVRAPRRAVPRAARLLAEGARQDDAGLRAGRESLSRAHRRRSRAGVPVA